mmetsp:Transcript_40070/g.94095  ORF Transcript_40070/g.94095 Transcript_40070/m.94095 type:complete len:111 (-) Transcript_40070:4318-4650(-)
MSACPICPLVRCPHPCVISAGEEGDTIYPKREDKTQWVCLDEGGREGLRKKSILIIVDTKNFPAFKNIKSKQQLHSDRFFDVLLFNFVFADILEMLFLPKFGPNKELIST